LSYSGITAAQWIGWGVTAVGILLSLGWNLKNQSRTDDLRKDQYKISQWERIRARIEKSADDLVIVRTAIIQQVHECSDDNIQSVRMNLLNQMMVDAQDNLSSALEEAATSSYCNGDHWRQGANGETQGSETSWDMVLACFEEAREAASKEEKLVALQRMRTPVLQIRDKVMAYCRVQDSEYDPDKA